MPPRKAAIEKTTPMENASELIISYLKTQNRPYSATDISANLHNKVTKAKCDKLLKELLERGEIAGKVGKQSVFWAIQDPADQASPEELTALDETITQLRADIPALKAQVRAQNAVLETIRAAPATSILRETVAGLQEKQAQCEQKLVQLKDSGERLVKRDDVERIAKAYEYWQTASEKRKRLYAEVEGFVLEQGPWTREEFREKCGIEEDA